MHAGLKAHQLPCSLPTANHMQTRRLSNFSMMLGGMWQSPHLTETRHICTEARSCSQTAAGFHVMLNFVAAIWPKRCVPSGGQSDATETAQLVPQDAFQLHYWEEPWQSLKWHKLSACIVSNQSSRRALKRSAVRSQYGHNTETHASSHTAWVPHLVRQHLMFKSDPCCISKTRSTPVIVLLRTCFTHGFSNLQSNSTTG